MCIICCGLDNKTLMPWEAVRNSKEIMNTIPEDHKDKLVEKITVAVEEWLQEQKEGEK
tara:strand:- start:33 stop:206 length:174 start_codon:yes stop_codon:yes gene_type:complete